MCGIAGSINYSLQDRAIKQLNHRGPDSHGVWTNDNIELIHLRLAIIDLTEGGHQPMCFKNWSITFNGEIYNYIEIRNELLKLGYSFCSNSDTEVILKSIDAWGIDTAVNKMNGMWAFAVYNSENKKMYLCRDRIGKKPLHYTFKNNTFLFSSEIKAFPDSYLGDINPLSNIKFLSLGYVPSPDTYYSNISKLPPASYLEIDCTTLQYSIKKYWTLSNEKNYALSYEEAKNTTEDLLKSSIKYRLLADVEVGSFLSGGIDSSLITALAQKNSSKIIKTFSIGFDVDKYDESKYAKKVAEFIGTEHQEYIFTSKDILNELTKYLDNHDEPFGDSAILPTMILSKMTKEKVTVALSGDGGDELFAGYSRYFFTKKYQQIFNKIPKTINKIIAQLLPIVNKEISNKLQYPITHPTIDNFYSVLYTCIKPWELNSIFNSEYLLQNLKNNSLYTLLNIQETINENDIIGSLMKIDKLQNLPEMMLHKVDRATMAYSLEARAPLLDYRLIEYTNQVPTDILTKGDVSKPILKDLLFKHIPKEYFDRPKSGFSVPLKEWFKNELKQHVENKIATLDSGIYNKSNIKNMYKMHLEGKANYQAFLFNLIQIK
jgi:asparagine synthase (glutamine-hydrolysing)